MKKIVQSIIGEKIDDIEITKVSKWMLHFKYQGTSYKMATSWGKEKVYLAPDATQEREEHYRFACWHLEKVLHKVIKNQTENLGLRGLIRKYKIERQESISSIHDMDSYLYLSQLPHA